MPVIVSGVCRCNQSQVCYKIPAGLICPAFIFKKIPLRTDIRRKRIASKALTPEKYYRLPWNLADNAITWLEPTTCCNLACEGCYREKGDHRPLADVIAELESITKLRKTDGISIAGPMAPS